MGGPVASQDAVGATKEAVALKAAVAQVPAEYGDTLGVRRLQSDVDRLPADLDELGTPAPGHRPGPAPDEWEEISDEPYDEFMWSDAEHEGFGAPDRRAP
jgi:hypothetical protein